MKLKKRNSGHTGFTTRSSHLRRLKNGEQEAWNEFYRKYRAMILAIGKKYHLPERESEDLMQEVAAVCHQQLQTFIYEPEHCRFRSFLFKVAENLSRNLRRKCTPAPSAELKKIQPDTVPGLDEEIMREYQNFMLERSLLILKGSVDSETYLVFEMLIVENRPIPDVAAITGKTANALYGIKHRCLKKLQKIIARLEAALETPPDTDSASAPSTTVR